MSTTTIVVLSVVAGLVAIPCLYALLATLVMKGGRPRPQQPPSDRERFNAMKRDWEQKP